MNINIQSVLLFALVLYALYYLLNRCSCKEGMKDSGDPKNSSDCKRLCKEKKVGLSQGQQCVYDATCKGGGAGCNIAGSLLCRLCDDNSTIYNDCKGYSPPPSNPSPPPAPPSNPSPSSPPPPPPPPPPPAPPSNPSPPPAPSPSNYKCDCRDPFYSNCMDRNGFVRPRQACNNMSSQEDCTNVNKYYNQIPNGTCMWKWI